MDLLEAVNIAESCVDSTLDEKIEVWKFLISSGHCWDLQGWYGRMAMSIIEAGVREIYKDETH